MQKKKILVIFKDDSSLLSARKFADIMEGRGFEIFLCQSYNRKYRGAELSKRQIVEGLGDHKVAYRMEMREVANENFLSQFDVVTSCKFPTIFELKFILGAWNFSNARPCFVATFPGIDFTPNLGIEVRKYSDILCLNGPMDLAAYGSIVPEYIKKNQKITQFSPFFYRNFLLKKEQSTLAVAFFSQSVMPETRDSRLEVLETIVRAAKLNPSVRFYFKLRHLPDENKIHTHKEEFAFQDLVQYLEDASLPNNFLFTTEYIGDLLEKVDLAITCASTAGMEALGNGVHCMFYTNYSGSEHEKHHNILQEFGIDSGMLVGAEAVVKLIVPEPNEKWVGENLTSKSMIVTLIDEINNFSPKSEINTHRWGRYCPKFAYKIAELFL